MADYFTCKLCNEVICEGYPRCQKCRRSMCNDCCKRMMRKYGGKEESPKECDHCNARGRLDKLSATINNTLEALEKMLPTEEERRESFNQCPFCEGCFCDDDEARGQCDTCQKECCGSCATRMRQKYGEEKNGGSVKCDRCTGVVDHLKIDEALDLLEEMEDTDLTKAVKDIRAQLDKRKAVAKPKGEPDSKRQKVTE